MKNRKFLLNLLIYICVMALAVFYLTVLAMGSKRDVTEEYNLYYIEHELARWPGVSGLDYQLGTYEPYASERKNNLDKEEEDNDRQTIPYRYTKGFVSLDSGLYTGGSGVAALYYRLFDASKDVTVEIHGESYHTDTDVYVGDVKIGTIESSKDESAVGNRFVRLGIDHRIIPEDGLVKISFVPRDNCNIYKCISLIDRNDYSGYKGLCIKGIYIY